MCACVEVNARIHLIYMNCFVQLVLRVFRVIFHHSVAIVSISTKQTINRRLQNILKWFGKKNFSIFMYEIFMPLPTIKFSSHIKCDMLKVAYELSSEPKKFQILHLVAENWQGDQTMMACTHTHARTHTFASHIWFCIHVTYVWHICLQCF